MTKSDPTMANPFAAVMAMQMQMMVGMASAMTAMMTAWTRTPALSVGDITVYFPFGQGYSQDIDPNTNWVFARAGQSLATADPSGLAAAYAQQQELISELLIGLSRGPEAIDHDKVNTLRTVTGQISALKR